jgi:general nucleoside transport system permease protein
MQTAGMLNFLATLVGADWRLATPLIFAATGEAICERSGVLNIGIEGIMLIGAFFGFATTYATGDLALGFGSGMASGLLVDRIKHFVPPINSVSH